MSALTKPPRPDCKHCGLPVKGHANYKTGVWYWRSVCTSCNKVPYRFLVDRSACSQCGFVPQHPGQIDVDHIDGVHTNNMKENLRALCANCHRLRHLQGKRHK